MNKRNKKIIVNSLTFSRVLGTILMPIFYNFLNSNTFLIVIGFLLLTDFLDGLLAKYWGVRTIFGSLLDMFADKMLALSILVVVGIIYPFMFVPLIFEILIAIINVYSAYLGLVTKSRELGRIKMWILGLAIFVLLLTGLSNSFSNVLDNAIFQFILSNKGQIETIAASVSVCAEFIVLLDYFIILIRRKKNEKQSLLTFSDILSNKTFIKKVLFDEEYYLKTINKSLSEKLLTNKVQNL